VQLKRPPVETSKRCSRSSTPRWSGISAILVPVTGEATVYRGHNGVPEMFRDFYEVFAEIQVKLSDIRDLGDRVVAIGRIRTRGKESGAETESPWAYVAEFKDGKAIRIQTYLDPKEALEAVGLSE
jgi:ketosteroid isomerase-like protein